MTSELPEFGLKLANGDRWRIVATEETFGWAEKFASILRLKNDVVEGDPRIILVKSAADSPYFPVHLVAGFGKKLPQSGWISYHNINTIWYHPEIPDVIIDVQARQERRILSDTARKEYDQAKLAPEELLRDYASMAMALFPVYRRVIGSGGFPMHGAFVEREGKGVLLAAKGGTGKSTCCRRIPEPWIACSDDEALVTMDRTGHYEVHSFPTWSDLFFNNNNARTWDVQHHVPLSAIFFLEQSKTDETVPIGSGVAAGYTYLYATQGYTRSLLGMNHEGQKQENMKLFDNTCRMAKKVPAYMLKVSLTGRFWEEIDRVLT